MVLQADTGANLVQNASWVTIMNFTVTGESRVAGSFLPKVTIAMFRNTVKILGSDNAENTNWDDGTVRPASNLIYFNTGTPAG